MEQTPALIAEKPNVRAQFGRLAGWTYLGADIGLTFKGPLEKILSDGVSNVHLADFGEALQMDGFSTTSGLIFTASGIVMMAFGDKNKPMAAACALGAVGWGVMTAESVAHHEGPWPMASKILSIGVSGYAAYQAYNQRSVDEIETDRPRLDSKFKENWRSFNERYPLALSGAADIALKVGITSEAIASGSPVMKAVCALWICGSTLWGLALPKVKKTPNEALFTP